LQSNLEQRRKEGILLDELPVLMRDAIVTLRDYLGIEYVWIDSLCIIQDSREDWFKEAAQMANVYSNAQVTIAATSSTGSADSLFTGSRGGDCHRHYSEFQVLDLEPVNTVTKGFGEMKQPPPLFLRKRTPHFLSQLSANDPEDDREDPKNGLWPLLSRGWVYQEQWLSRRTLHFGKHEIVWVCNETSACECAWYQFDKAPSGKDTIGKRWDDIVHEYSNRAFTQVADRLPALAGIATVYSSTGDMKEDTRGRYLCGLWEKDLPGALFWRVSDLSGTPLMPRSRALAAGDGEDNMMKHIPTWSWVSVVSTVEMVDSSGKPGSDFKIVDFHVSYNGNELMGDVKGEAWLRVSGLVVHARVYHGSHWRQRALAKAKVVEQLGDSAEEEEDKRERMNTARNYGLEMGGRLASFLPDYAIDAHGFKRDFVADGSPVLCLVLGVDSVRCPPNDDDGDIQVREFARGLVLRQVQDKEDNDERSVNAQTLPRYERIGSFQGWDADNGGVMEFLWV